MPTVSVIIPTYNRAHLLAEAIASVLDQTYEDWEALVVDDGSTDDTASVVAGFHDPRVRYIYQENAERSVARNRGLAAAQGEYIAFLDDDDLYLPHKLATEVTFMEAHPEVDLCMGGIRLVEASGAVWGEVVRWQTLPEPTLRNCLYGRCWLATGSVFMRREVLDRMDHWFDPRFNLAEDADFCIRVVMAGLRLAWLPEVLFTYRLIHTDRKLRILVDHSHAIIALLDKLFARPDMPSELLSERSLITQHWRCWSAAQAYGCGQVRLAQRELLQAFVVEPSRANELGESLAEAIGRIAADDQMVSDPRAYIGYAYDNLPVALMGLHASREDAWRAYCRRIGISTTMDADGLNPSVAPSCSVSRQ